MRRRVRAKRFFILAAAAIAAAALAGALYLRVDKRHVFREVAGEYAGAREVERLAAGGQVSRRLELLNQRGEAVASVWLRRPARLAPAYRTLLVYAGRETGERILDLIPARDDLVLAAIQYPYREPSGWAEKLRWPLEVRRAAFRSVAGGLLAVSFLERDEGLDPERLVVVGASLGSAFAVAHAALDPRVPTLVVLHGGGDLPFVIRSLEAGRGRPWRGRLYAGVAAVMIASFEPLRYVADVAPRETIVVGARTDRTFPVASTLALYEQAREPKRLSWTPGEHVRARSGAELSAALDELDRVLGPPPPVE